MKLPAAYFQPGMTLSSNLYGLNGELLLRKGAVLTARNIMSIRRNGILAVNIKGFDNLKDQTELKNVLVDDEIRTNIMKNGGVSRATFTSVKWAS